MTQSELSYKFPKAHICMGIGTSLGYIVTQEYNLRHPIIYGALVGLLLSLHLYRQCAKVMFEEYKRLKYKRKK